MRDDDPTTGRYLQGDPLGLVAGASVYGYALQSPAKFLDLEGEHPVIAAMILAGLGSVAIDYAFDRFFGDQCYSVYDGLTAFGLGALAGGGGFAATGIKRVGREFSHTAPTRWLKKSRFGRWLDRRANGYRSLNGNYVRPRTHAKTDFYRRVKGMKADDMYPAPLLYPLRAPLWSYGAFSGLLVDCKCSQFD